MRGRPELPNSFVVDLNSVVRYVRDKIWGGFDDKESSPWSRVDVDIVIPVYESQTEITAKNIMWILDNNIYASNKSRFVEYLETSIGDDKFYIYDKFKSDGYSHKKSYKQGTYRVDYPESGVDPIFLPLYWRVN